MRRTEKLFQKTISDWLLSGIESERRWDKAFATSSDLLTRLAEEALAEHRAGQTQDLDPVRGDKSM